MLRHITIFLCILISTATFAAPLDRIIVVINNNVITESELNEAINTIKKQLTGSGTPLPPASVLQKQVLDQLINKKLQLDLAEQAGINIQDKEVDETINNIAKQNHLSPAELYSKVEEQGLTKSEYRKEIHDELTLQRIQQQEVGSRITITPQEVDDFTRSAAWQASNSKEYHLEDILIALPASPSSQDIATAKKRAEALLAKLHKGMSFEQVSIAESGSKEALQGGDLGWRKLPEIPAAFSNSLIHMKPNELLGPVLTQNGFHIVHLVAIRQITTTQNKQEQQKQIEQLLFERKYEEALQSWIMKLHSEAFINMHPEND